MTNFQCALGGQGVEMGFVDGKVVVLGNQQLPGLGHLRSGSKIGNHEKKQFFIERKITSTDIKIENQNKKWKLNRNKSHT